MKERLKKSARFASLALLAAIFGASSPCVAQEPSPKVEVGCAAQTIWSGYWWPRIKGEILGPLGKYDRLNGANAVKWEKTNNPIRRPDGSTPAPWEGLCHGWAAACVMEAEPDRVLKNGSETLTVGDQKGLLTVAHSGDFCNYWGNRCNDVNDEKTFKDLEPGELWRALRENLREAGSPMVLDLEPGPEVWNYPVYAYRVQYWPKPGDPRLFEGELELWMADDGVAPDFVGLKRVYKKLTFEIERDGDSPVLGSGVWTGSSVADHPDFAWVPLVANSCNPEVSYERVLATLGRTVSVSTESRVEAARPTESTTGSTDAGSDVATADEFNAEWLEIDELKRVFAEATPNFRFDLSLAQLRTMVDEGDPLELTVSSDESGYLYVFTIDSDGSYSCIYPTPCDNNYVEAKKAVMLPTEGSPYRWRFAKPGEYRIAALICEKKLGFCGSLVGERNGGASLRNFDPAQFKTQSWPSKGPASADASETLKKLGRYSFDQETFYTQAKVARKERQSK